MPLLPALSADPPAIVSSVPLTGLTRSALNTDARLRQTLTLRIRSTSLSRILESLVSTFGISFGCESQISQRRITIFTQGKTIAEAMEAITLCSNTSWKRTEQGYVLFQTNEQIEKEQKQIRDSQEREIRTYSSMQKKMIESLQKQASIDDPMGRLLSRLSNDQLKQLGESVTDTEGVIGAGSSAYLQRRYLFSQPISSLSSQQKSDMNVLFAPDKFQKSRNKRPSESADHIGWIAGFGGSIHLASLDTATSEIVLNPFHSISSGTGYPAEAMNDLDPELEKKMGFPENFVVIGNDTKYSRKSLKFPQDMGRQMLPDILENIATQKNITIACDDWLRTRQTFFNWLLRENQEFSVKEALVQLATVFSHRFRKKDEIFIGTTLTPGLDSRCEPPAELLAKLQKKTEKRLPLDREDVIAIAALSEITIDTLIKNRPRTIGFASELSNIQQAYPSMHLWAILPREQQFQAESNEGLDINELPEQVRILFRRSHSRGIPQKDNSRKSSNRFLVNIIRDNKNNLKDIHFTSVSPSSEITTFKFSTF